MLNIRGCISAMRPPLVTAKSRHVCAKAVRTFLEYGGMSTAGRPRYAWAYRLWLPQKGFNLVAKLFGKAQQAQWTAQYAQPGDIAVMPHGLYGHICMWSGGRWVSDFVQNNMWVYGGNGLCLVFRYGGQMTPMIMEPPLNLQPVAQALNKIVTNCTTQQIKRAFRKHTT